MLLGERALIPFQFLKLKDNNQEIKGGIIMLLGDMQDWKPNVASIIEYAADIYPESEVVSKLVSGEVHRTNYKRRVLDQGS